MPGRSNRASPSVRGWSRAIWSCVTTVTGENVLVATGRIPIGTARSGTGAGRGAGIGLGLVTLISSSATACWACAGDVAMRSKPTVDDRTVPARRKPKGRARGIETHIVLYRFIVVAAPFDARDNPAGFGQPKETLHRCN